MKKNTYRIMIMLVTFSLLSACGPNTAELKNNAQVSHETKSTEIPKVNNTENDTGTLTIWGYEDTWKGQQESFEKVHPGIKLVFKKTEESSDDDIQNALTSGDGPDIIYMKSDKMGKYNTSDALEDLLKEPYNAGDMLDKFENNQLSWVKSLDGKALYALPIVYFPAITYYREDILKQYGFPADPETLGNYMENPDNWIKMARELKKHDKWIMEWTHTPVEIYTTGLGFFDKDLNFNRNTEGYGKMLNLARTIINEGLSPETGIWSQIGQDAIRQGRIVMVYMGSWGNYVLGSWAPEQQGKWRATRLPFGAYGMNGGGALAITKNSKHKKIAWELIKTIYNYDTKSLQSMLNIPNEYLGGQHAEKLYADLRKKTPEIISTPMDDSARTLWQKEIDNFYYNCNNLGDGTAIINEIDKKINDSMAKDRNILLESLKK
ncbi:MAG: extracellular solute-binding protein [Bacillota bacterium]|nr:extracellular solute-binding protein [Bacillota bacterium]